MDSKSKHPQDLRQIGERVPIPDTAQNTPIEGALLAENGATTAAQ